MNPLIKSIDRFYFRLLPWILVGSMSVVIDRLALMQINGLLGFGGALVTVLFAITSVMYGRARATTDPGQIISRAQIADECLVISLIAVMGLMVTFFVFFDLSERYVAHSGHLLSRGKEGPELVPAAAAFLCTLFFVVPMVAKLMNVAHATAADLGLSKVSHSGSDTV